MREFEPSWLAVALEEYKTLRQESLTAIERQHQIVGLGAASAGALIAIGAGFEPGSSAAAIVLSVLVPLLIYPIEALWLGEFVRMVRAGAHIAMLESRINGRFVEPGPLTWETQLRSPAAARSRVLSLYRGIFGVFTVLALGAGGLGLIGLLDDHEYVAAGLLLIANLGVSVAAATRYWKTERQMRRLAGEQKTL